MHRNVSRMILKPRQNAQARKLYLPLNKITATFIITLSSNNAADISFPSIKRQKSMATPASLTACHTLAPSRRPPTNRQFVNVCRLNVNLRARTTAGNETYFCQQSYPYNANAFFPLTFNMIRL